MKIAIRWPTNYSYIPNDAIDELFDSSDFCSDVGEGVVSDFSTLHSPSGLALDSLGIGVGSEQEAELVKNSSLLKCL